MLHPVVRIYRLVCGYPGAGEIRQIGDLGRLQMDLLTALAEGLQNGVHHGGMERVGCVQTLALDRLAG